MVEPETRGRKVLVLLASDQRRGAEIEGAALAEQLRSVGWTAEVLALAGGVGERRIGVEALGRSRVGPRSLWALRRRASKFDLVIAYGSSTLPACAIALFGSRTRFVYRSIGDPRAWVRSGWHQRRTGLLFGRASAVVALWDDAASSINRLYAVPERRLFVIPNARSGEQFVPPSAEQVTGARSSLALDPDAAVIAAVGSLTAEKCVDSAIRAVASIDHAVLVVAGAGPLRDELEHLAEAIAPGRVRFVGSLDDVRPLYHAMDALVVSSATEGMPGAIIEAGLCGRPTTATEVGAVAQLVESGRTGVVVPAGDGEALAAGLRDCLTNHRSMGSAARNAMCERFEWAQVVQVWVGVLKTVLD